jgi:hypothetical protein
VWTVAGDDEVGAEASLAVPETALTPTDGGVRGALGWTF